MASYISADKIEEIRSAADIVEIVSNYVTLKQRGKNYFGLCPFHPEKTPSFSVNPEKQIFHCFGCGVGGNVIAFIMKIENLQFPEAVKFLADKLGITIPEIASGGERSKERLTLFKVNKFAAEYFQHNLLNTNAGK
ncbi:DNA primase, partial [candidate division KSB1 bacterium]